LTMPPCPPGFVTIFSPQSISPQLWRTIFGGVKFQIPEKPLTLDLFLQVP
jgi:hypothetical protein